MVLLRGRNHTIEALIDVAVGATSTVGATLIKSEVVAHVVEHPLMDEDGIHFLHLYWFAILLESWPNISARVIKGAVLEPERLYFNCLLPLLLLISVFF